MALTSGRLFWLAALLLASAPSAAPGQETVTGPPNPDGRPWYVTTAKWAKWPTLAGAIALTAAAISRKLDADQVYDGLQLFCLADTQNCVRNADGTYVQPAAEALYQETVRLDRQARNWMWGGQAFLFVSAGLWVIDLVAGSSRPDNIPYAPLEPYAAPGVVGARWRF